MNFSIVKDLDLEKLDKKIKEFETDYEESPYIFMNNDTINKMTNFNFDNYAMRGVSRSECIYKYMEHNVYIDNSLEFGEIELR